MIILNYRRLHIITSLLENAPYPITAQQLSANLHCSERTIRYELDIVEDWLQRFTSADLIRKTNTGIWLNLDGETKTQIKEKLASMTMGEYECNREERMNIIALILLTSDKPHTISKLKSVFLVSRGTILKDLHHVEHFFQRFSIELKRQARKGIWLEGNELKFRQALTYLSKELDSNLVQMLAQGNYTENEAMELDFPQSMPEIMDALEVKHVQKVIDPLLTFLDVSLSDEGRMTLYLHIGMVLMRTKSNHPINMQTGLSDIYLTKEYKIAEIITKQIEQKFRIELPEEEVAYIALHILGNQNAPQLSSNKDYLFDEKLEREIEQMTSQVEKILEVTFRNRAELVKGLLLHIQPAIYRAQYGLVLENALVQEVKEEFKRIFDAVRIAILPLEKVYDIVLSEKEIAYISMHYGGNLFYKQEVSDKALKIILICSSGLGTANLLKNRIESLFTNIEIKHILSLQLFMERTDWDANLIISTIDIPKTTIPQLTVNPLLPEDDYDRLSLYLTVKEKPLPSAQQLYESIWPVLNKYCVIEEPIKLTEEMIDVFQKVLDKNKVGSNLIHSSLDTILDKNMIQLDRQASNWEDAIKIGVAPLEKFGVEASKYEKEIVSIIRKQGPYMAVAPGILLAHGSKKDIKGFALSFTRLDPPIPFGHDKNDPIALLFVFVAPNSDDHLPILQQLLEPLIDSVNREALLTAKTPGEVVRLIESN